MLLCLAYWFFFTVTAVSDLYDQHRVDGLFSTYSTPTKVNYGLVIHPQQTDPCIRSKLGIQFSGLTSAYDSNETLRRRCLEGHSRSRLYPIKEEFPSLIIGSDHQPVFCLGVMSVDGQYFEKVLASFSQMSSFPILFDANWTFLNWRANMFWQNLRQYGATKTERFWLAMVSAILNGVAFIWFGSVSLVANVPLLLALRQSPTYCGKCTIRIYCRQLSRDSYLWHRSLRSFLVDKLFVLYRRDDGDLRSIVSSAMVRSKAIPSGLAPREFVVCN